MSHRLILCTAAFLATACVPAGAQSGSTATSATTEALPAALTDWLYDARDECERGGGTFRDGDYWQSGDFNGDGRPDFLVTRAALGCEGNDIFTGGTAGDAYDLLVSSGDSYAFASEGILAHDAEIATRGGKTVVLTPDPEDSRIKHWWEWNGSRLVMSGNTDGPL